MSAAQHKNSPTNQHQVSTNNKLVKTTRPVNFPTGHIKGRVSKRRRISLFSDLKNKILSTVFPVYACHALGSRHPPISTVQFEDVHFDGIVDTLSLMRDREKGRGGLRILKQSVKRLLDILVYSIKL
jgi:hypothetical protein